jgi:predicted permease
MKRILRLRETARHVERDVDDELAFHIAMRTRKLIDAGLDPASARVKALEQFGDFTGVRAEVLTIDKDRERAMRFADLLGHLRQDVAYSLRSLRQHKQFTAVVLAILALGIGANTATFTLVDSLMLRRLRVAHPEQLVTIGDPSATGSISVGAPSTQNFSYPVYVDLRDQTHVLSGVYAMGSAGSLDVFVGTERSGKAEHPRGRLVTGNFFSTLGVQPIVGRTFAANEDRGTDAEPVAVISYGYWQRRFTADSKVVGRSITVNGVKLTIIGITPPGFFGDVVGQQADLWIPLGMRPLIAPHAPELKDRGFSWLLFMGRLAPGVTLDRARTELSAIALRSIKSGMNANELKTLAASLKERAIQVEDGSRGFSYYRVAFSRALFILMSAVGLVLLVVCANVANLMLARGAARSREMSVRLALGAGRSRLMQQLLTESVVLAALAAALGLAAAVWGSRVLLRIASGGPNPIPLDVHPNAHVFGYMLGLTVLTTVLFGLVPAWRASRAQLVATLRTHSRAAASDRPGRMSIGKLLVVAQVALSALLLVGTGMLLRSMHRVDTVDLGLARDRLVIGRIEAGRSGYEGTRLAALTRDVIARIERVPGVAAATFSLDGLFSGTDSRTSLRVPAYATRADSDAYVSYDGVGPNYFRTIGARILRGRDFDTHDNESGAKVAIVNETMARYYFPGGDALGKTIIRGDSTLTVVGIVHDVEGQDVRAKPVRRMYVSIYQLRRMPGDFHVEVRTNGDPSKVVTAIREAIGGANSTLTVDVEPLNDLVRDSISQDRLVTRVVTFFGGLALFLAALGLYGVMAYGALRRTGEFGLRMALGARAEDITRMVVREAVALTVLGVIVGVPAGLAAAQLIRRQLFGVGATDPVAVVVAVAVLVSTGILASYLPAARASRVAPLEALRSD